MKASTEELYNAYEEYAEAIGDNFPTYLLGYKTEEEQIHIIRRCIEEHKTAEEITGEKYKEGAKY